MNTATLNLNFLETILEQQAETLISYSYNEKLGLVLEHYIDGTQTVFFRTNNVNEGYSMARAMNGLIEEM